MKNLIRDACAAIGGGWIALTLAAALLRAMGVG